MESIDEVLRGREGSSPLAGVDVHIGWHVTIPKQELSTSHHDGGRPLSFEGTLAVG